MPAAVRAVIFPENGKGAGMIRVSNVPAALSMTPAELKQKVSELTGWRDICEIKTAKRSVDARNKRNIHFLYSFDVSVSGDEEQAVRDSLYKDVFILHEERYTVPVWRSKGLRPVVAGTGPAGMMAAITAAEYGNNVTIIEKNSDFGKKLLITGKGRCNITSSLDIHEFIANIPGNGSFLYSAFNNYTNQDIIEFLKKNGVAVKEERGNRIFPTTDKSVDVLNCFIKKLKELKIKKNMTRE